MHSEIKIILVEDDPADCSSIVKYSESVDGCRIVAVTNSSDKALQYVKEFLPDAVILDLELNRGSGNGLLFLKGLRELNLLKIPYILITTNNISEITYTQARTMGADFIISKHQENYTEKSAVDFLCAMKSTILNAVNIREKAQKDVYAELPVSQAQIRNRIVTELDLIGISPKSLGRKYLIDAIMLTIERQRKNLCREIAKKYTVSEPSVQRAMQNAINKAWKTTPIEDLSLYYTARIHSDKGAPMLMELICYYAEKIGFEFGQKI